MLLCVASHLACQHFMTVLSMGLVCIAQTLDAYDTDCHFSINASLILLIRSQYSLC